MISLWFSICNFGRDIAQPAENATDWCRSWHVAGHKYLEIQLTHWATSRLFAITLNTHFWGTDHAGPEFTIEILGWYFGINLQDSRHWNYEAGRFQTEAEAKAEADEWAAEEAQRMLILPVSQGSTAMSSLYSEWNEAEEVDTQVQPS